MTKYIARLILDIDIEAPKDYDLQEIPDHINGFNSLIKVDEAPGVNVNVAGCSKIFEIESCVED